ncbi:MAG: aldo/keto reductase [Planctomycetaceae bacterium]|nr:aldo/keto reductase [Planctomycetaceae bacterium]
MTTAQRALGNSGIFVSPIAMGCWPIAGMTSLNVTEENSLATLAAAFECGINFFDTAYCYGAHGESEKLIARALGSKRDQIVIATKGGIEWGPDGKQVQDGRPATLRRHCDESLRRLATDRVELLYLHSPDPRTPVRESAGELKRLMDEGKTRTVGASNVNVAQLKEFMAECPVTAVQPHYNLLQREIDEELLPFCREQGIALCIYWPLMKGFLSGKLPRDHQFAPGDGRAKYPMFQGEEWTKNHDFLDALRPIAADAGCTLSQLVLAWTIRKPGITSALVGAKRPDQIIENAGALKIELQPRHFAAIDEALKKRGTPVSRRAV